MYIIPQAQKNKSSNFDDIFCDSQYKNKPTALGAPPKNRDRLLPRPEKITTRQRVLYHKKCVKPDGGDGWYNVSHNLWVIQPCKLKDCDRHWRRYGCDTVDKICEARPKKEYWYAATLSLQMFLTEGRFKNLPDFMSKLSEDYPSLYTCACFHRGKNSDHIHLVQGSDTELDFKRVRQHWKSHIPNPQAKINWHGQYCAVKAINNVDYEIAYMFILKHGQGREIPPWRGIPLERPYRLFWP